MARKSAEELEKGLFDALRKLDTHTQKSQVVRHVKSGKLYCISNMAYEESSLSPVVVYSDYGLASLKFTRPLDEFIERFTPITQEEALKLTRESRRPL